MNLEPIKALIETVHRLRADGGCPWDRAQTHQTLRPYLIEEAYEVLEVLDQIDSDSKLKDPKVGPAFKEELGDLLMQVMLHSEMTSQVGAFDFSDVAGMLNDKLIRRHPHVFGDAKVDGVESAFQAWEKQKAKEKSQVEGASILDGLPKALPALQRAARLIEKVSKVGFQWPDMRGPLGKVEEELGEFKEALEKGDTAQASNEFGDLLFSLCNLAAFLKIQPEDALRSTMARFEKRFKFVEAKLKELGKLPEHATLKEMDQFWEQAKSHE